MPRAYLLDVKFFDNDSLSTGTIFIPEQIELPDGDIVVFSEKKEFTLKSDGRIPDELFEWVSKHINVPAKEIGIHINEI